MHNLFASTSDYHRASYLLSRHPTSTLSHAIRYPICTLPVISVLEQLAQRRGKRLKCTELPRRLVRGLGSTPTALPSPPASPRTEHMHQTQDLVDLPLIAHLLTHYSASPNSKSGYFLARAVVAKHLPLVHLLLDHGADPSLKGDWAVLVAIKARDLGLVKLLLEREPPRASQTEEFGSEGEEVAQANHGKKRRRSSGGGSGKRLKIDTTRTPATSAMLTAAAALTDPPEKEMVDYLTGRGESGWLFFR